MKNSAVSQLITVLGPKSEFYSSELIVHELYSSSELIVHEPYSFFLIKTKLALSGIPETARHCLIRANKT